MLAQHKKRFAALVAAVQVLSITVLFAPTSASAAQLTDRQVTLSTPVAGATTASYQFDFKVATSTLTKAVRFQLCDSPLESVACTQPASGSFAAATLNASQTGLTGFTQDTTLRTATNVTIKNATGVTPAAGAAVTLTLDGVTNPSTTNYQFYLRVTTYNSDTTQDGTTDIDFGAVAVSTSSEITVSAIVQETLTFCTYSAGTCAAPTSTSVDLGILSSAAIKTATSKMEIFTNAQKGYAITYFAPTLTSGSNTITAAGATANASTPGTEEFGISLTKTGAGAAGATIEAPYATAGSYALVASTTTKVAGATAAADTTVYDVTYGANIAALTESGQYSSTFRYVATGTF